MRDFLPEGCLMDTQDNSVCMESVSSLCEAYREQKILEARATVCDANHNLTVGLGCIRGVIPRKEGVLTGMKAVPRLPPFLVNLPRKDVWRIT